MIRTRLIIAAWLLLLVPTLLLGVGALQLLQGESERLRQREIQSSGERLAGVAANLELAIAEVRSGVMQRLAAFPDKNLPELLSDWRTENPLVRNVFVWQEGSGLLFPNPEQPASDEERQFVRRYLPLFSGEQDWQPPLADNPAAASPQQSLAADSVLSERTALRKLASRAPAAESAAAPKEGEGFWRSWYADDRLHLLGWYEHSGSTRRVGLELEMVALLSRLLVTLSPAYGSNETLALIDGNGQIFHQSGSFPVDRTSQPLARHKISGLPHWAISSYADPTSQEVGSGFFLVGSLLTGSFLAAILLGGSLLLWQSIRQQRDARQKTSFVSNVSHELKTPLTTIRMYAEMLDEGNISSAQKQRNYLQTIIRESQRLGRLVNNVLDFSRIEQNKKVYNIRQIDLTALLEDLLAGQQPRLRDVELSCHRELPQAPLWLNADPDAVEQILLNLIDNAVKYAAAGGELRISLTRHGENAELALSDKGPGIPPAQQQRIFDKFHRLDSSLTSAQPGVGLGLSIARQLARDMGGELSHQQPPAGGSCFCLTLPLEGGRK